MQAVFTFNGSEEYEIWSDQVSVHLTRRPVPLRLSPAVGRGDPTADVLGSTVTFSFSKSQTRSVASAMMGAAADL